MSNPSTRGKRGEHRPVIVIGGGIAGLAAAARLAGHGIPIKPLEAKPRLGGRIHTLSSVPIELGAEFIHGQNRALCDAISQARLSTKVVPNRHQLFSGGKLIKRNVFQAIGKVLAAMDPRQPDQSFQSFLQEQDLGQQDRLLALNYVEGFNAAYADRISSHALLRAELAAERMQGSWQGRIARGYGALVSFFESQLCRRGGGIFKQALVHQVTWKEKALRRSPSRIAEGEKLKLAARSS